MAKKLIFKKNNKKRVLKEAITILFEYKKYDKDIMSLFKHYDDINKLKKQLEQKIVNKANEILSN